MKKNDFYPAGVWFKCSKFEKKTSMKVFKFGGASVKDADAVRNIGIILRKYKEPLVVVVSAMGKTTNALERVLNAHVSGDREKARAELDQVRDYHMSIVERSDFQYRSRSNDRTCRHFYGFVCGCR